MRLIYFFLFSSLLIFTSTSWASGGHGGGGRSYYHSSYSSSRSSYSRSRSISRAVYVQGDSTNREHMYRYIIDRGQMEISIPILEKLVRSPLNVGQINYEAV